MSYLNEKFFRDYEKNFFIGMDCPGTLLSKNFSKVGNKNKCKLKSAKRFRNNHRQCSTDKG